MLYSFSYPKNSCHLKTPLNNLKQNLEVQIGSLNSSAILRAIMGSKKCIIGAPAITQGTSKTALYLKVPNLLYQDLECNLTKIK